ncbi:MAG TPA: hypothetical protein VF984_12795 [Actinomycetota bacterium]
MAGNTKEAWEEVGERFSEWGHLLSERYRQRDQERGSTPQEDRRKLEDAVGAAVRQLDAAFTSLGETLRDPQAKQSLGSAARALRDAMATTVSEAGEQLRRRAGSTGGSGRSGGSQEPPADG